MSRIPVLLEELRGFVTVVVRFHLAGREDVQSRIDLVETGFLSKCVTIRLVGRTKIADPLKEQAFCHVVCVAERDLVMAWGGVDALTGLICRRVDQAVAEMDAAIQRYADGLHAVPQA